MKNEIKYDGYLSLILWFGSVKPMTYQVWIALLSEFGFSFKSDGSFTAINMPNDRLNLN